MQPASDLDAMTRLNELGTLFVREGNLEPVLSRIVDTAVAIAGSDFCTVQLLDAKTHELRIVANRGFPQWWLDYWNRVTEGSGSCGTALGRRERVIVQNIDESPVFPVGTPGYDAQIRAGVRAMQSTPVISRSGRPLGMVSTHYRGPHTPVERVLRLMDLLAQQFADIIDRAEAEAERERLLVVAESEGRAKDEFMAMLGHELRNPLAPIVTALDLIRLRDGSRFAKERHIIERQVGHMVRLVDDLLDVSRIAQGKVALKREPISLADAVAKAVEMASPLLEQRQHRFDLAVAGGIHLNGDIARLAQVLANLLTNAAKYTEPGGTVGLRAVREGDEVVLTVTDDGRGIEPELLPRIFDLFVQGRRGTDRSEGGLGLGLSLVRSLIKLHGGTVVASSEGPGRGSRFVIRLPALSLAASPETPPVPIAKVQSVAAPLRILVVDDNRDAAEMLIEILRMVGHEVSVAHDGPDALRASEAARPDVAILDIGLPVMDGYELATRLRERHADVHMIAVTGYGQEHDRARSERAGFRQHFVKPVGVDQLLAHLASVEVDPE
jgi:signal transduction histidine kinase/ActR/RegA family two-component response regulator